MSFAKINFCTFVVEFLFPIHRIYTIIRSRCILYNQIIYILMYIYIYININLQVKNVSYESPMRRKQSRNDSNIYLPKAFIYLMQNFKQLYTILNA